MSAAQYDVVGIGNAIVDVIARADDGFLQAKKLAKGAMTLIDEAQAEALYAAMGPGTESSGGSAANTMAGVASLGGYGVAAIVIFSAYMLYDIKRVIDGGETNYVTATLAIYLDVYIVFQNLLALLGIFGGDE